MTDMRDGRSRFTKFVETNDGRSCADSIRGNIHVGRTVPAAINIRSRSPFHEASSSGDGMTGRDCCEESGDDGRDENLEERFAASSDRA